MASAPRKRTASGIHLHASHDESPGGRPFSKSCLSILSVSLDSMIWLSGSTMNLKSTGASCTFHANVAVALEPAGILTMTSWM